MLNPLSVRERGVYIPISLYYVHRIEELLCEVPPFKCLMSLERGMGDVGRIPRNARIRFTFQNREGKDGENTTDISLPPCLLQSYLGHNPYGGERAQVPQPFGESLGGGGR